MTLTLASKPVIAGQCKETFKACFVDSYKSCSAIHMKHQNKEIQAKAFCTMGVQWHCLEYATFQVGKAVCDKDFEGPGDEVSSLVRTSK